jgi:hypothetical protein
MEALVKPHDLTRPVSGSPLLSAWVTGLLTLYCGGALAIAVARGLEWTSVGFTGFGVMMFALMTAWNLRAFNAERRAQAERSQSLYSFTASRHISKPARSP